MGLMKRGLTTPTESCSSRAKRSASASASAIMGPRAQIMIWVPSRKTSAWPMGRAMGWALILAPVPAPRGFSDEGALPCSAAPCFFFFLNVRKRERERERERGNAQGEGEREEVGKIL